jgi:hypothetical protein
MEVGLVEDHSALELFDGGCKGVKERFARAIRKRWGQLGWKDEDVITSRIAADPKLNKNALRKIIDSGDSSCVSRSLLDVLTDALCLPVTHILGDVQLDDEQYGVWFEKIEKAGFQLVSGLTPVQDGDAVAGQDKRPRAGEVKLFVILKALDEL